VIANGISGPDAVRHAFESTAEDKGPPGRDNQYGAGIVDAGKALNAVSNNTPPVANNDNANTPEETPVVIVVLGNDTDADGDPLTVANLTQPAHGTATLNADQTVTYTPDSDFAGTDSFTYRAHDGKTSSDLATVTIDVSAVNDPPTANDDAATIQEHTAVVVNVLANDSDPEGDELNVAAITQPANGSATLNGDNTVTYTPDSGFVGEDTFTYTIADTAGANDTATVTVTVQAAVGNAHVSIALSKRTRGKSRWRVIADVRIRNGDASGTPIAGATITDHWSGAATGSVTGTTKANGKVRFRTGWIKGSGSVTFTVDKVTKDGVDYPLAGDTSASMTHAASQR